jgi:hypothetical protein
MASVALSMPAAREARCLGSRDIRSATLFGDFGEMLEDYRWTPGNLFDVPYDGKQGGLAWLIKGSPAVAIGRAMARGFGEGRPNERP